LIRFGTAGWSYPDWDGTVYPARTAARFDHLAYLARFLDCVEVNASFYRIPRRTTAMSWVNRVAFKKEFLFTIKLWRGFTHGLDLPAGEIRASAEDFVDFLEPLKEAGRLGGLLVQYPYSFHRTQENRERLEETLDRFNAFPLVVEVRHDSWMEDRFLETLRDRGVGFCNIDQPALSRNIPTTAHVTSNVAYMRLHGRNRQQWFKEEAGRDERYDYLYSEEELSTLMGMIQKMQGAGEVFVVANNHARGQALANTLELKSSLGEEEVLAPPELVATYPRLREKVKEVETAAAPGPYQGVLPF
jgi:uncharacterized protein YecE (DUF72 family)